MRVAFSFRRSSRLARVSLTLEWGGCFVHRATGASSINDEVVFQQWLATDASIKGKGLTYSIGRMQQRMVSPVVAGALR